MCFNFLRLLMTALLLLGAALLQGQNGGTKTDASKHAAAAAPSAPPTKPQFFSGIVTTLDKEHITVSRVLVGKPAETRTFAIKAGTKVSKSVKTKAKVTVRYQHEKDDGDVALEIQIRSNWRFSRS